MTQDIWLFFNTSSKVIIYFVKKKVTHDSLQKIIFCLYMETLCSRHAVSSVQGNNTYKVVFCLQVVLTSWVFISVKMTMEMIFGGQYNPVFPCLWALYFHRHMVLAMIVQFAAYSGVTLILNIAIFVKVKCRASKRNQLGKRNRYPLGSKLRMSLH